MRRPMKITDRVYIAGGGDISDPKDCCVYLVDGGTELAIIDAGAGDGVDNIIDNISQLGFDPSRVKLIIATHGHIDHIGGLKALKDHFDAQVAAHELELAAIQEARPELTAASFYGVDYKPVQVDIKLSGKLNELKVGDVKLQCLFTPGHTPGGVSVYADLPGGRVLFGQDIHGPFSTMWGSDMSDWRSSMEALLKLKADILCEGHFGVYAPAGEVEKYIKGYLAAHTR
ncbi:MAG: MBL fold metallo-hydrolase [Acidobacteriota bacterium]